MKSFYITLSIIIVLFLGWFYINVLLTNTVLELNKDLTSLQSNLSDGHWEEVESNFQTIQKKWFDFEKILTLIVNHDEVEKVNLSLTKIHEYIKKRESLFLLGELTSLKYFINHIKDNESLSLDNIF